MTNTDTQITHDRTDDVQETHRHPQMGVKVEEAIRKGYEEDQRLLKVYRKRKTMYGSLDGGEPREVDEWVKIGEFSPQVSTELLFGLAEAHGYDLEGK